MTLARDRADARAKRDTFQAWQTARFYVQGRSKKGMPSLKQALNEIGRKGRAPQSRTELRANLAIIVAQYGLKVTKGKV